MCPETLTRNKCPILHESQGFPVFSKTWLSGIVWKGWNDRAGRDPRGIQPIIQETEAQREEWTWPKALSWDKDQNPLLTILHSHSWTRRAGATKSLCLGKAQGGACWLAEAPAGGGGAHLRGAAVMRRKHFRVQAWGLGSDASSQTHWCVLKGKSRQNRTCLQGLGWKLTDISL